MKSNFKSNIKIIQGVSAFRYECTIIKSDNTEIFSTKNKHEMTWLLQNIYSRYVVIGEWKYFVFQHDNMADHSASSPFSFKLPYKKL